MKDNGKEKRNRKAAFICAVLVSIILAAGIEEKVCAGKSYEVMDEKDVFRQKRGMDLENDYKITEKMEGSEEDYIVLISEGKKYYMRRPAARKDNSYLESEGAFRFEMPDNWIYGYSDLDEHLDEFWEDRGEWNEEGDYIPCFLWGIEDNDMGANAFSDCWDEVSSDMRQTAETVFGDKLKDIEFQKYALEDGNEVYGIRCSFDSMEGEPWMVSVSYRFGEKNMLES